MSANCFDDILNDRWLTIGKLFQIKKQCQGNKPSKHQNVLKTLCGKAMEKC